MKKLGVVLSLLVGVAGCGMHPSPEAGGTDTEIEAEEDMAPVPSVESSQEIRIVQSDGWTFFTRYTYYPSTRRLQGYWSTRGPGGSSTKNAEQPLTSEGALDLEARLNSIRRDALGPRIECLSDVPTLSLEYLDASGQSRKYLTNPSINHCDAHRVFVREDDARAVFDTCQDLLPMPE